MLNFKISETEDYEKLVPFFIENELEFSEDEPVPTDLVKCWQIVRKDEAGEEQLIGAFVLAKREDEFIVDGIAIAPEYRKYKLGKTLLEKPLLGRPLLKRPLLGRPLLKRPLLRK